MLIWRIITAVVLIPLVLWGIFALSPTAFAIICAIVFFLGAMEWSKLVQFTPSWLRIPFLLGFAGIVLLVRPNPAVLWIGTLFWLAPLYWCITYQGQPKAGLGNRPIKSLIGWVYLACAYFALVSLRQLENGPSWLLLLFLLIWSTDTFAYFVGRAWGKRPLASKISPNKTLEGFLGGVIGAMLVAALGYFYMVKYMGNPLSAYVWFPIAFVTILLGVLGDLFESLMKRLANVKDSGHFLPGHGGILDRLDSLIAALPFYTLCLSL